MENSHVTKRKPVAQLADRSPSQIDKTKDSVQADNDIHLENGKPEISANSEASTRETVDTDKIHESSGIREATSAEAAAFTNAVSLKFTPPMTTIATPVGAGPDTNISDLFIAMTVVVLGTVGLAALILKAGRREAVIEPDQEAEQFEFMPVEGDLGPPLQANFVDEDQFATTRLPEHVEDGYSRLRSPEL